MYVYVCTFLLCVFAFAHTLTHTWSCACMQCTAEKNLSPGSPVRLGLMLNCSVFYFEVVKNPKVACDIARAAFDKVGQSGYSVCLYVEST